MNWELFYKIPNPQSRETHFWTPRKVNEKFDLWLFESNLPQLYQDILSKRMTQNDLINKGFHSDYSYKDMKLRPHQNRNVAKLLTFGTFGIFDKPGTGKTHTILAALRADREKFKKVIIIPTVKSTFKQWVYWAKDFFDLDIQELSDSPKKRKEEYEKFKKSEYGILITTKEKVRAENSFLLDQAYDLIIIDEAHTLNNNSTTSKALTELRMCCKYAWILTGTPIDRNLLDIVGLLHFMYPYTSYNQIRNFFGIAQETRFGKDWKFNGSLTPLLEKIRDLVSSQTTQEEVYSNFKEYNKNEVYLKAKDQQRIFYNDLLHNFFIAKDDEKMSIFANDNVVLETEGILAQFIRLQQIALDPRIVITDKQIDAVVEKGAKTEWIIEFIKKNPTKQILLFSKFTTYLKLLEKDLLDLNIAAASFHGELNMKERHKRQELFNGGYIKVLLVQNIAGGTGLRLQNADLTIKSDLSWKPSENEQIDGRMLNTSTENTKDKNVITLYLKDSLDQHIQAALNDKIGQTVMLNNFKKYAKDI